MNRILCRIPVWIVTVLIVVCLTLPVFSQTIQTAHERSNFEQYTSYEEMMQYLQEIQASSKEMLLGTFGRSIEGREQPYAVFSRPMITQPWEAQWTGKPIILIYANVHGGEKTLRESVMLLIRELATEDTEMNRMLDNMIVITAPSVNLDGFERSTRGNARGLDLNRDYMKLETQETRNLVQNLILTWRPHISVDGHNGGSYPYNITYQANSHATPDQRITEHCDFEIFPYIDKALEEKGYRSFWYSGGDSTSWTGGGYDPRISRNYAALINNVGILLESPRQDMRTAALCGLETFKAILSFAVERKDRLYEVVNRARTETIEMGQKADGDIPVQMEYGPEDWKVSYDIAIGPRDDQKLVTITGADLVKKPVILKTRKRPYAYILEPRAEKTVEMLKRQKILIEVLQEDTEIDVEAYELLGVEYNSEYDHPAAVTVQLADETIKMTQTFPKGSYVIRTGQLMGRVATHLLEPETNDSAVHWNMMNAILPRTGQRNTRGNTQRRVPIVPIFKLMVPHSLPTKVLHY
ncbi:M14 family zinc carboxypeptidase [candidate division KSB1 bacterium]